jgi:hypothetical protein
VKGVNNRLGQLPVLGIPGRRCRIFVIQGWNFVVVARRLAASRRWAPGLYVCFRQLRRRFHQNIPSTLDPRRPLVVMRSHQIELWRRKGLQLWKQVAQLVSVERSQMAAIASLVLLKGLHRAVG